MVDFTTVAAALEAALHPGAVKVSAPLDALTTFRIGGAAAVLVEPSSFAEVADTVLVCEAHAVPWRVMGLGSDLLVSDEGVASVVIRLAENLSEVAVAGSRVRAAAGASNAAVARAAQRAGLAGYEFASGIPGTIGGAAIMNAGAYGGEFRDVCARLTCLTPAGEIVEVAAWEACWGYRRSMMSDCGYVVLEADLQLTPDDAGEIQALMDDLQARREEKQPLDMPSAGSTFKRPRGYFAGKLIQDAGLRGFRMGGAQVSEKHTGFVVNAGGATAADVRALIAEVQRRVFDAFGVHLEPEVRMWGFSDSE